MKAWLQRKFLNWLVKDLYRFMTAEDLLVRLPNGHLTYRGKQLEAQDEERIFKEAEIIKNSLLWRFLLNGARYYAYRRMFEESEMNQDSLIGKTALWNVQVLEDQLIHLQN